MGHSGAIKKEGALTTQIHMGSPTVQWVNLSTLDSKETSPSSIVPGLSPSQYGQATPGQPHLLLGPEQEATSVVLGNRVSHKGRKQKPYKNRINGGSQPQAGLQSKAWLA